MAYRWHRAGVEFLVAPADRRRGGIDGTGRRLNLDPAKLPMDGEVGDVVKRSEGDAGLLQAGDRLGAVEAAEDGVDLDIQGRPMLDPQHVGGKARIGGEFWLLQHLIAEGLPFPLVLDRQHHLMPVLPP